MHSVRMTYAISAMPSLISEISLVIIVVGYLRLNGHAPPMGAVPEKRGLHDSREGEKMDGSSSPAV